MTDSEKFCLKWNDFESNISSSFKELRLEKDFFDVTLACEDESQVEAHKVVLSACSTFFRGILRRNNHPHPLLYLKGVKSSELSSILNFMYLGEANIAQDDLTSFLSVAEELRIKGLTESKSPSSQQPVKPKHNKTTESKVDKTSVPSKRTPSTIVSNDLDDDDIQEVEVEPTQVIKHEPRESDVVEVAQVYMDGSGYNKLQYSEVQEQYEDTFTGDSAMSMEQSDFREENSGSKDWMWDTDRRSNGEEKFYLDTTKDWDTEIRQRMTKDTEKMYQCLECDYSSKLKASMVSHVQGKHLDGFSGYLCKLCAFQSATLCGFQKHLSRQHGLSCAGVMSNI